MVISQDVRDVTEPSLEEALASKCEITTNKADAAVPKKVRKHRTTKSDESDKKTKRDSNGKTKRSSSSGGSSSTKSKEKKKTANKESGSSNNEKESKESANIRRSNRIKSINVLKQKSRGYGLVKQKKDPAETEDENSSNGLDSDKNSSDVQFQVPKVELDQKPVKVKSRWRRSSELEMYHNSPRSNSPIVLDVMPVSNNNNAQKKKADDEEVERRLKQFVHLKENQYLTERISCKEAKKMT